MGDVAAPTAPVTTAAANTDAAPAPVAPPAGGSNASPAAGAAPSGGSSPAAPQSDFGSPDKFTWDSWDGQSYDAFPEPIRPWAERVGKHYQGQFDSALTEERSSLEQIRGIYEQLLEGHQDPRLGQYEQNLAKYKTQISEYEQKLKAAEDRAKQVEAAYEHTARQEAERIAAKFKADNAHIFEDPKAVKMLGELLDEDWELENIPQLMGLDEEIRDQIREAKREGAPEKWALKLAEQWKPKPAKPRAGAELVAGAGAPAPVPNVARSGLGDAKSFDELRALAAQRAMSRAQGR